LRRRERERERQRHREHGERATTPALFFSKELRVSIFIIAHLPYDDQHPRLTQLPLLYMLNVNTRTLDGRF